jgi:hypothetical protein
VARLEDDEPRDPTAEGEQPARRRTAAGSISTSTFVSSEGAAYVTIYVRCERTGDLSCLTLDAREAGLLVRNLSGWLRQQELAALARSMAGAESYIDPEESTAPDQAASGRWRGDPEVS